MAAAEKALKAFLYKNLYRARRGDARARRAPSRSCATSSTPISPTRATMPEGWREGLDRAEDRIKARHVADFLAGMTDTYALKEHRRLFDHTPDLG